MSFEYYREEGAKEEGAGVPEPTTFHHSYHLPFSNLKKSISYQKCFNLEFPYSYQQTTSQIAENLMALKTVIVDTSYHQEPSRNRGI